MAGKINNAPPPDAPFGTVDGQGRVTVSPLWYRWLTTKQNAGEILVEGSVTGGVLSDSVQPPTVLSQYQASVTVTANNPSPDNEANRTTTATLTVPATVGRVSVEVWAAGQFLAAGTGAATVSAACNVLIAGATFNAGLYGSSTTLSLVGPGFAADAAFSTPVLYEVLEDGTPARTYKLSAKKDVPGSEAVSLINTTLYAKITRLS